MSYNLDTPFSSQVIFLNSQNSNFKSIDGQGEYSYNFQTPVQLPTNCDMLISVTDAQIPNIIPNVNSTNNKISFSVPTFSMFFTITIQEPDGTTERAYNVNEWLAFVNEQYISSLRDVLVYTGSFNPQCQKFNGFVILRFKL